MPGAGVMPEPRALSRRDPLAGDDLGLAPRRLHGRRPPSRAARPLVLGPCGNPDFPCSIEAEREQSGDRALST